MPSISAPVQQVLQARQEATNQQVGTAVAKKQLDSQQATGDAINAMLEKAVSVQKQIASGHLDVKV